jgi:hypothetical protein
MQKILRKNDEVKCLSVLVSPLGTEGAAVGNAAIWYAPLAGAHLRVRKSRAWEKQASSKALKSHSVFFEIFHTL